jgi:hypothetical protein
MIWSLDDPLPKILLKQSGRWWDSWKSESENWHRKCPVSIFWSVNGIHTLLHLMVVGRSCKDSRSILTMQLFVIRGGLKNVLRQRERRGCSTRPTAQTLLRVASSSSGISRRNWPISIAGAGRTWRVPSLRFSMKLTEKPSSRFLCHG